MLGNFGDLKCGPRNVSLKTELKDLAPKLKETEAGCSGTMASRLEILSHVKIDMITCRI